MAEKAKTYPVTADRAELKDRFQRLFAEAKEIPFEDGVHTEFSQQLVALIDQYSTDAVQVLAELFSAGTVDDVVIGEALRWLGDMDDKRTHQERRWLLERCLLKTTSHYVKDGAIIGLSYLDDPAAIPYLEQALKQEHNPAFVSDIEQVIEQLRETQAE